MKRAPAPACTRSVLGALCAVLPLVWACAQPQRRPEEAPPEVPIETRSAALKLAVDGSSELPRPTENWLGEGAEAEQKTRRRAWFAELHAAPPGVDWRAIEERNGLAQIAKRNQLARRATPRTAGPWVERGSDNQAGRMHVAAYSSDGQTLYAGSSKGGVWKGKLDGTEWTPIGDNLYGGAHWLAVVDGATPADPDVVLAASDDGRVHVSSDDGATWVIPGGISGLSSVRRVLVTSEGSETVFLMARKSSRSRLYRSIDRMASFTEVNVFGNSYSDLWTSRTGGSDLYVSGRAQFYRSTDMGDTWTAISALPQGATTSELAGSEAGAPRFWVVVDNGPTEELHRSDDGGLTWTYVTDVNDYWGTLNASITDADVFAWGGVEVWRTEDAGASFARVNSWGSYYGNPAKKLHADIPGIDVWPGGPAGEIWYVSTDGGLYESRDLLASVDNLSLSGLRVSQYYTTLTGATNGDRVLAGAQDQGYQFADQPPAATGTTLNFDQLISGDYGHLTSGNGNLGYVFSTYPGFILAHVGSANPSLYQVSFPSGESNAWLPPVVASNQDFKNFFFCATRLYEYTHNGGSSWSASQYSTQNFQTVSGEYLSAFTFSPVTPSRAYAATNRGRLYTSDDYGVTWTQSASIGPQAHYFYGTALLASRLDTDTVWVGGSGYGVTAVYRSTDGGATFQPWDDGLPDTLVYCLGEAPDGSGVVFCGTETAAYMRGPTDPTWSDITAADAPVTTYWSIEALANENTMRYGTYGRGIWDYQIDIQARTVSHNGSGANATCFVATSAPELGATWDTSVDASVQVGATLSGFVIYDAPSSGTFLGGSEVLVDLSGTKLFTRLAPSSGAVDAFSLPVPNDPSLAGLLSWAQGVVIGASGYRLCNALEVVIGY